jgi:hypothetical protein
MNLLNINFARNEATIAKPKSIVAMQLAEK